VRLPREKRRVDTVDNRTVGEDLVAELPSEEELRRDIAYFEGQVERLASPTSVWEQGALKCYQVLARQRREMLDDLKTGELTVGA
jgi:hypothetical protein